MKVPEDSRISKLELFLLKKEALACTKDMISKVEASSQMNEVKYDLNSSKKIYLSCLDTHEMQLTELQKLVQECIQKKLDI